MKVWSLGREDPLEEGMATHSSILAWRIPWTEEPGWLQSTGLQRVRHDWSDLALSARDALGALHPWQLFIDISHKYAVGWMSLSSFHRTRSCGIEKLLSLKPGFSALFWLAHAEKTKKRFPSSLTRDAAQKAGREMTGKSPGSCWSAIRIVYKTVSLPPLFSSFLSQSFVLLWKYFSHWLIISSVCLCLKL